MTAPRINSDTVGPNSLIQLRDTMSGRASINGGRRVVASETDMIASDFLFDWPFEWRYVGCHRRPFGNRSGPAQARHGQQIGAGGMLDREAIGLGKAELRAAGVRPSVCDGPCQRRLVADRHERAQQPITQD